MAAAPGEGMIDWLLDPEIDNLNHGGFGAVPRVVLEEQRRWQEAAERNPTGFLGRSLEEELDRARRVLAAFVGADPAGLVFVPNATTGVNAVVRSLPLRPGDEILTTDHVYNACRNVLDFVAGRNGARAVVVPVPFPLESADEVVGAVTAAVTDRTVLALLDHVTSPTGLILPVERLVPVLEGAGIPVLVDGAHAPGMLPLQIDALGASYYTGNCHKWVCAPRGAALLAVREDRREGLVPVSLSHGWNDPRPDRPRFHKLFDWTGTEDPSARLAVPAALRCLGAAVDGGWPGLMARNHGLAVEAQAILCRALGVPPPAPEAMIGSLAAVPLPPGHGEPPSGLTDPLAGRLLAEHRIEVPVFVWPAWPGRVIRVSAQLYNHRAQYERLAEALVAML